MANEVCHVVFKMHQLLYMRSKYICSSNIMRLINSLHIDKQKDV